MGVLEEQWPHLFGTQRQPALARPGTPPPTRARPPTPVRQKPVPLRAVAKIGDEVVMLVPIGDLARAVGRSVGHIRELEKQGILPPPRARRRVARNAGWRWYDQRFVDAVAQIALEERIPQRTAVHDMTAFRERVWAADRAIRATGGRDKP